MKIHFNVVAEASIFGIRFSNHNLDIMAYNRVWNIKVVSTKTRLVNKQFQKKILEFHFHSNILLSDSVGRKMFEGGACVLSC